MIAEQEIATQFCPKSASLKVTPFGHGVINETFLASYVKKGSDLKQRFILQKLNKNVFPEPDKVMQNLRAFLEYINTNPSNSNRLQFPEIMTTRDKLDGYLDDDNQYWRAISFIEGSKSFDIISGVDQARLTGQALGQFHTLVHDMPLKRIYDTLPGFHVTPSYVLAYRKSLVALSKRKSSAMLDHGMDFVNKRLNSCSQLQDALDEKILLPRIIHGDPKLNNFLFNETGDKVLSLVDLDTLTPGLIHYDIADCLRSVCNLSGENAQDIDNVSFDLEICESVLGAWLNETRSFLTLQDYQYIYTAIRLLPLELGLRFLTDYLGRNKYFKVEHSEQNLERAIVQFKLVYDIEQKEDEIQNIISQCL